MLGICSNVWHNTSNKLGFFEEMEMDRLNLLASAIDAFRKAFVSNHTRRLADGRVVQVRAHRTSQHSAGQLSLFGNAGLGMVHSGRRIPDDEMPRYDHRRTVDLFASHDERLSQLKSSIDQLRQAA